MEEIKDGEYIRTKNGIIAKVDAIYEYGKRKKYKRYFTKKNEEFNEGTLIKEHLIYDTRQKYILKHSKDITDLIEKDDFVNGCRVYEVEERGITVYQKVGDLSIDYNWIIKDEIQTILTHEQYENNCYRIGE